MPDDVQLSRSEIIELVTQNAEMRRLLAEHQWSGLTPVKSGGVCPECCGSSRHGHRRVCDRRRPAGRGLQLIPRV